MLDRYLTLSPFPPSLRDPASPPAVTLHRVRPSLFDQSGEEELPDGIEALPARPTVYLTLGTVRGFNDRPQIVRAFADGLRDELLNLVVALGRNLDPAAFRSTHANVRIERYIPQSLLLPHCRLVICHGGSGTVLASILHGLPMVIVPIAADQPRNAERCAALGVARCVQARGLTAETAREAVLDVLHGESYRQRAERLRQEILAFPGLDRASRFLERLAAERAPLIA
jgi:MGT family glycosyltransferase